MPVSELQPVDSDVPAETNLKPLALFDLDGTITDPADGIMSCHRWALGQVGFEAADQLDANDLVGPPVEEAYERLAIPADVIDEAVRLYRERFAVAGWLDDTPYDGVVDMVHRLVNAGWLVGIATMKPEIFATRILDRIGLAEHMAVIAGSDPQRKRITKRLVIEHALTELDQAPRGVAMVGDRRHDIDAALSLQMTAIGVTWGFGSVEELIAANAHAIATTPVEVADFLLG